MADGFPEDPVEYVFQESVLRLVGAVVVGFLSVRFGDAFFDAGPAFDWIFGVLITGGGAFLLVGGSVALLYRILLDTRNR